MKVTYYDIEKKKDVFDKKLEIYSNGVDNLYPNTIEAYRNNSVTATMASSEMSKFIIGKGFGVADNFFVNSKTKLGKFSKQLGKDLTDFDGFFIHVAYDANFEPAEYSHIPFAQCRIGKKDSKDYNGKILLKKDWSDKKSVAIAYDVFNPDKEIVKYQAEKQGGKHRGQILFFNNQEQYHYPLSRIHAVRLDCDSEHQASVYRNTLLRKGFFGKELIITRPLVDNDFIQNAYSSEDEVIKSQARAMESEADDFSNTIKDFIGVENTGGALHLEVDFKGEDLNDAIIFKNIDSKIDDKLFSFTEETVVGKILMAYNNMPIALVKSPDSALLGNSGESLRVAKETFFENTQEERDIIETVINDLMRLKNDYIYSEPLKLLPLITKEIDVNTAFMEKQKAQAVLKGSVGGVTALLDIIRTVSEGTTSFNSGLAIVKEIYGVEETTARELLGNIQQKNDTNQVNQ